MAKALLFSDVHVHAHKDSVDRLQDCLDVLNWVFEESKKHNCEYIFFLGDLFHERAKIDVKNYLKTFEVFMKHMIQNTANQDMYLLVGNHDMYHKERWDINSVKPLSAIPRVHIVETPQQIILGGRKIDWMPHTDNPVKELNDLKERNNGAGDILLGHMAVHGALLNLSYGTKADVIVEHDNDMVPVDASIFSDWLMTFLGHYHGAQKITDSAEFVGSPLQLNFGESFQDKHIIILDLETLEKTYIQNNFSPKHFLVTPRDIQDENYKLDSNFVRVTVENNMTHKEKIDLKKQLYQNHSFLTLDIKTEEKKIENHEEAMETAQLVMLNIQDFLKEYMIEKGVPEGISPERLLAIGNRCLERK